MRFLFSLIFRLVLLLLFTFGFVVLFQHGPDKFPDGAKKEWNALVVFVGSTLFREKGTSASAAPQPAASAATSPAAKHSPSPTGAGMNKPAGPAPAAPR